MDVTVKFLGGAESVTGSRYLLTLDDFRLLFDCGLFQGLKELRLRNWDVFPVDAASIDAVVISHAHIDHTGYLPRLVKEGFHGPIYCTHPTADLLEIMLLDSAKLQEEEAIFAKEHGYSKHANPLPLYTVGDVHAVFPLLRPYGVNQKIKLHESLEIIFRGAGHLLGAAITEVLIKGKIQTKKITFSGDLGRSNDAILAPPEPIDNTDILFIESTYGAKDNPAGDPGKELERIVNETFNRQGVLLIPAFAVGRTQTLMHIFHKLISEKRIPDVPVYVDSPMAISATYLYYKYPTYHHADFNKTEFASSMETNMMVFVKTSEHSKHLNNLKSRAIIISSSGMMTGGRILHHLYHRLRNPNDTLLIAGYQAEGTRGRRLMDKEPTIRIFGEEVPVNCKVECITSLSGHADRGELFQWMKNFKAKPKMVFTVHGENPDLSIYAEAIRKQMDWNVRVPQYLESIKLFSGL